MQRGKSEEVIIPHPEITVKTVCGICNSGWMSDLEAENIPIIGSMLQDIPVPLDEAQQKTVGAWAVKTSMVSDTMKGRLAPNRFHKRGECVNMRLTREIPARTLIWIGRIEGMHLAFAGTDFALFSPDKNRVAMGSVDTFVAGHFVTQAVTVHVEKENIEVPTLSCKMGSWDESLIQIWPIKNPTVHWPPKVTFTNGGPLGIAYLMDRWRIGKGVDQITPA
ncbi:MAG TPA: hypothetical protein VK828_10405 [Terriglobales bacterium]|nr:hypothetical protein [Terriglobales bacterium]